MSTTPAATNPSWDPGRYLTYAGQRGRPFVDLLAQVHAEAPRVVVDLGCGPGNLTALLARRWPGAAVLGVDASPAMIEAAGRDVVGVGDDAPGNLSFAEADLRDWLAAAASGSVDVLVSNATLQWVPGHLDLLPELARVLAPGGWLAVQVPGNMAEPSHTLRDEIAFREPYAPHVQGVVNPASHDPEVYLAALQAAAGAIEGGLVVDAWETTYLHVLTGDDPVFTWVSGTGARPVLDALPDDLRPGFVAEFKDALRAAYPPGEHGTVLPFRRVFVVARRG